MPMTTSQPCRDMDFELTDRAPPGNPTRASSGRTNMNSLPPPPPPPTSFGRMAAAPATAQPQAPVAKTLDELADEFLSPNESDTMAPSPPPLASPVLSPEPLPADATDLQRLQLLVARRAWSDVLLYTNQFKHGANSHYAPLYRTMVGQSPSVSTDLSLATHQQELTYILLVHVEALVKLGSFKELSQEIQHWTFCHHHQSKTSNTDTNNLPFLSWVPWSLHIAAAATLQFGDGSSSGSSNSADGGAALASPSQQASLDALWAIRSDIPTDDSNSLLQVENALHNVFVSLKDWRMALVCLQKMIELVSTLASVSMVNEPTQSRVLTAAWHTELLSRQGRILLQAGALDQASILFHQASLKWKHHAEDASTSSDNDTVRNIPAQLLVNDGLLKFSHGKHDEALESFHSAVQHFRRTNALQHREPLIPTMSSPLLDSCGRLYSETINNMALCALYTCRLPQALHLLESLIREDVTNHLTDRVALNLCTLYELASDTAASARKKRVLQLVARRFHLHDIKPESFRVS